ncbi:MAG: DUF3854 domain-containing protein [Gemmataceae bacterium]|nr:DUF3854 domain-containing protein [Gemmataceae bacterium]
MCIVDESIEQINYPTDPIDAPADLVTPMPLASRHLAELRASGLSDATIRASGICTTVDHDRIGMILRWASPYRGQHGGALEIPFFDLQGKKVTGYRRLKFDSPRAKGGKKIKYESPVGIPSRVYFPPVSMTDAATDTSVDLIIVEGEKKCLAADQTVRAAGWKCRVIGLVGVYGFAKKRKRDADEKPVGDRELLPDLDGIVWQGRKVYVVYDSDAVTNPNVQYAEYELAHALTMRGAVVVVVRLPGDSVKVGLDDYLLTHTADDLRRLMDAALPAAQPTKKTVINEAIDDPDMLARTFLAAHYKTSGIHTLRVHLGSYWRYAGTHYDRVADDEVEAEYRKNVNAAFDAANEIALQKWLVDGGEGNPPTKHKISRGLITNVGDAVRSHVIVSAERSMPCWLDGMSETQGRYIAMQNGRLDIDALFAGRSDYLRPHTPSFFNANALDYDFNPSADCPIWREKLAINLDHDNERLAIIQEYFGYMLTPETWLQKCLINEGPGGNGKGMLSAGAEAMLGVANFSTVPLELFAQRFALTQTVGKLANIISEVGEMDRVAEGIFKQFVVGDPVTLEKKFEDSFTTRPTAKLLISTNTRPRFADRTNGVWRRIILVPWNRTVSESEKIHGLDKPEFWERERAGILNWALVGLHRLLATKRFTESQKCNEALADYKLESNPAKVYLLEHVVEDAQGHLVTMTVYKSYRDWAIDRGYSPLGENKFTAELKRLYTKIERRRVVDPVSGGRVWAYVGVRQA